MRSSATQGGTDRAARIRPIPFAIAAEAGRLIQFSIAFVSLAPAAPGRTRYEGILAGLENAWTSTRSNVARYTNVPPGDYEFRVQAIDRLGGTSRNPATLRVEILPPFWERVWFRGGAALLVISLIVLYVRLAQRRFRIKSRYLEKMVSERTEQLREHVDHIKRLKVKFETLSTVDELTGLYNRRFFYARIAKEVGRIVRAGRLVGILVIDVDHFKQTNDTYGHLVGDELLKGIAALLNGEKRGGDMLARFGGEEFIVACELVTAEDLKVVADRFRTAVERKEIVVDDGQILRKTISVGGAVLEGGVKDVDDAVRRADEMLYEAKRTRNACVVR